MASSSSNPSSTSSSTTSTPSAAPVLSERQWPQLPTRAAAPAASAGHGAIASATGPNVVAPDATASTSAPGVSAFAPNVATGATASAPVLPSSIPPPPPPRNQIRETTWGGSKGVPPPTNFLRSRRRGGRNSTGNSQPRNSVGVSRSQRVFPTPSQERATSTFAPVTRSTEGSSSSASAWSKPLVPSSSTVASTSTDTRPASAASSSTTPSPDTTLVPNASGSVPAVATSIDTAPEPVASTSSAPVVTTIADLAPQADALSSASSSAPSVETIVDAAPEPDTSTSTPSSSPGVTTIVDPAPEPDASASTSATTSAPGATPTIPSLRDNWVALHWGIVPRPVECCPEQQAFGGNDMPPVEALHPYQDYQLWAPREEVRPPRSFGVRLCWECLLRPARVEARPCGHFAICVRCYCYANSNRFVVCPYCGLPITWLL